MTIDIEPPLSDVVNEVYDVVLDRHHKYGPTNISDAPGGPLNGIRVRLYDKLARLNNYVDNHGPADFDDDSLRDCFVDVCGYGLIGLLVLDGEWPGVEAADKPIPHMLFPSELPAEGFMFAERTPTAHLWSELFHGHDNDETDDWPVGTTFKANDPWSTFKWRRSEEGWSNFDKPMRSPWRSLSALINYQQYTDGTITEPTTAQKEAA